MSLNYLATKPDVDHPGSTKKEDNNEPIEFDYDFLNDSPLSQIFDFCVPKNAGTGINVFLCIYRINTNCELFIPPTDTNEEDNTTVDTKLRIPFLQYVCIPTDTNMTFPSFSFNCDDTSSDTNTELFEQECTLHLLTAVGIDKLENVFESSFMGMVYSEKHNSVMAVFNSDELPVSTSQLTWAIVDELVFKREIWGVNVDTRVSDILRENPILWTITYSGGVVEFPFSVYMVTEMNDQKYTNEERVGINKTYEDSISESNSLANIGNSIDTYKYGYIYGNMYLFSPALILSEQSPSKFNRYAIFVNNAKYLLESEYHSEYIESRPPMQQNNEYEINEDEDNLDTTMIATIYFVENDKTPKPTQLWGTRYIYQFTQL